MSSKAAAAAATLAKGAREITAEHSSQAKKSAPRCNFCRQPRDTGHCLKAGKFYHLGPGENYYHYFCLLFSRDGQQTGRDDEGVNGFLVKEIQKEEKRSEKLNCIYCGKNRASAQCSGRAGAGKGKCDRKFHYTCGAANGCQSIFWKNMNSFCPDHAPKERRGKRDRTKQFRDEEICLAGCQEKILKAERCLSCPTCSCRFHTECLQQMAIHSGRAHYKCPHCLLKHEFKEESLRMGIYLPEQDASWENPDEEEFYDFQGMGRLHQQCDAKTCLCPKGRQHHMAGSLFEIVRCDLCGMKGTHMKCSGVDKNRPEFTCDDHGGEEFSEDGEEEEESEEESQAAPEATEKKKKRPLSSDSDSENDSDIEALFVDNKDTGCLSPPAKRSRQSSPANMGQRVEEQLIALNQRNSSPEILDRGVANKEPFSLVSRTTGENVRVRIGPASFMRRQKVEEQQRRRPRESSNLIRGLEPKHIPSNARITAFQSLNLSCSRRLSSSDEELEDFKILSLEPFGSEALAEEEDDNMAQSLKKAASGEEIEMANDEDNVPDIVGSLQDMPVIDVSGMFDAGPSTASAVVSPPADAAARMICNQQQQQPEPQMIRFANAFPVAKNVQPMRVTLGSGVQLKSVTSYRQPDPLPLEVIKNLRPVPVALSNPLPTEVIENLRPVHAAPEVINLSSDDEDSGGAPITFFKIG